MPKFDSDERTSGIQVYFVTSFLLDEQLTSLHSTYFQTTALDFIKRFLISGLGSLHRPWDWPHPGPEVRRGPDVYIRITSLL
jgi:hypothetical protein